MIPSCNFCIIFLRCNNTLHVSLSAPLPVSVSHACDTHANEGVVGRSPSIPNYPWTSVAGQGIVLFNHCIPMFLPSFLGNLKYKYSSFNLNLGENTEVPEILDFVIISRIRRYFPFLGSMQPDMAGRWKKMPVFLNSGRFIQVRSQAQ